MKKKSSDFKIVTIIVFFIVSFAIVAVRLFYWQVLASEKLVSLARTQYQSREELVPIRGEIRASDDFPLAVNKKLFLLYASLPDIKESKDKIADKLSALFFEDSDSVEDEEKKEVLVKKEEQRLLERLKSDNIKWTILKHELSKDQKQKIEDWNIQGLGFQEEQVRFYPEASMAAHLLGFVGKNEAGQNTGYFGLEGFYNIELKGRTGLLTQEKDAFNKPILIGSFLNQQKKDGQNLTLYLDRSVQFLVEKELKKAIEKYGAKSGSVTIIDPKTGGIIALACWPSFDPQKYFDYGKNLFKNPVISDSYEPGSTFKVLVMAAGLDSGAVKVDTKCNICDKPLKIDKYEIKTWNDEYHPDSNMTDVIKHSDNIGMVFTARKMGLGKFYNYLKRFGIGEKTEIDVQGEISGSLKPEKEWNKVDLATASFGQGIAVTAIQVLKAAAAIANQGKLMEPHVVKEVFNEHEKFVVKPKVVDQVVDPITARQVTEMMVQAVEEGDVKWLKLPGYRIAGKTGTAQIPVAGHYDKEKTIASFVGFAPADEARFAMLVKLREPESSPWGSETAAPLFFNIAKKLLVYYGIQPE